MAIYLNGQVVSGGGQAEIQDSGTVVNNGESGLDAVGVVSKSGHILYDWVGRKEEYESGIADGSIDNEWVCWITDDDGSELSSGVYIGSIVKMINTENYVPEGLLYCDGSEYRRDQFEGFYDNYLQGEVVSDPNALCNKNGNIIQDGIIKDFNSPIRLNLGAVELRGLQLTFSTGEDITSKQLILAGISNNTVVYIENGAFYTESGFLGNVVANGKYAICLGDPEENDGVHPLLIMDLQDYSVVGGLLPEWGFGYVYDFAYSLEPNYAEYAPLSGCIYVSEDDSAYTPADDVTQPLFSFEDQNQVIYKLQVCSYEEYQNELSEKGYCDKIAVDYNNQLFRVPTITNDGDKKHYIVAAEGSTSQSIMDWSAWQGSLEGKANKSDIPDVSNLATKEELEGKANKSDIPDISNLATKDEIPTDYATKTEVDSKQDKGNYALKSEIPTNNNQLTNGAGYITSDYHDNTKQDVISDLATIRSGASKGATALQSIPTEYVTETELNAKGYLTQHQDISHLATKTELNGKQAKGNYISYTDNTATVAGTEKTVSNISTTAIFVSNGIVMGGSASDAGLATRGICGVSVPDSTTGACTKDNLYINYDSSNNSYNANRQLILQAGTAGTHYGNNLYQYAAARGDAVKNYADATYAKKSDIKETITTLASSGTISLVSNSINRMTCTGTTTFSLPASVDNTIFNQILVQLEMSSVQTINLGTTHFFKRTTPDLSAAGNYNILFEYDGTNWVCGVISKGTVA